MKIDARGWVFQVQTGGNEWTQIGGINSFELNPGENNETVDTTDFDSDGEYEGEVMQRGASLQLDGHRKKDDDTGETDPGQAAVDALATKKSRESLGSIRFRHDSEDEWTVWPTAYVVPGSLGGGNNDKTSWSATFTRSGAATTAEVSP